MIQLVLECAADAGDLWLQDSSLPLGESAAGVCSGLAKAGLIDEAALRRWRRHVRAPNRIIHDYDQVDAAEVLRDAAGLLEDAVHLLQALEQRGPEPPAGAARPA